MCGVNVDAGQGKFRLRQLHRNTEPEISFFISLFLLIPNQRT